MCGFAVFIDSERRYFSKKLLKLVNSDLETRGPDSSGIYNSAGFSAVFRRLSIIDPDELSNQPMQDKRRRYTLVFNGCIYNFKLLRSELIGLGVNFRTTGDTEVVLEGLIKFGTNFISKLEGMFSIVFWDNVNCNAILARDPMGIKPLYLTIKDKYIAASSLLKPLRRLSRTKVDINAFKQTLILRNPIQPYSGLEGISIVPPGKILLYNQLKNKITQKTYFNLKKTFSFCERGSSRDIELLLKNNIKESVEQHLQSDVGFSVQLSGGIDSSMVTAIAAESTSKKIDTYGIKLNDPTYDESYYRKLVVERYKTNHHEVLLDEKKFTDNFDSCVASLEAPTAHFGCVFLKLLYKEISKTNKVSLVGEGADELFGGYSRYTKIRRNYFKSIIRKFGPKFFDVFSKSTSYPVYKYLDPCISSLFHHDADFLNFIFPDLDLFGGLNELLGDFGASEERQLFCDQTLYLPSLLLRQDKISMAHSVEVRTPFVHKPLVNLINRIKPEFKFDRHTTKKLLKKIAEEWLPKELIYRKKNGLNLPITSWLENRNGLGALIPSMLDNNSPLLDFVDKKALKSFIVDFQEKSVPQQRVQKAMWVLISTNSWLKSLSDLNYGDVFRR